MKIAVHCGVNKHFVGDIVEHLKKKHEVRAEETRTTQELFELMKWSDVSWFEWCEQTAITASHLPKVCRNIVRLHGYEAYLSYPEQIDWNYIDDLIIVSDVSKKPLKGRVPEDKIKVIHNGVNLDKFTFNKHEKGFNLVCAGYINPRKNNQFLLYAMHELLKIDQRYFLHFVGKFQNGEQQIYLQEAIKKMGIQDHVAFHDWVKDLNDIHSNMNYIVSASYRETFGYSIAEGMLCGLKPVIHWFDGVESIWPEKYVFTNMEEFIKQITSDEYNSQEYKKYVVDNYSLEKQMRAIDKLIMRGKK
ncbi:glycosyltransferase [Neomegalonema sp.]|uniref:glycosyltransferase n=1 Tax=Neomegalonema sp. TaxID=2039713 RepID=UPI00260583FB|nr:glycosyltransferase [Neomegalonema sp.]MDD2869679.1 glycosyltransferase [Neomegalonema sp.]